jgi:hypothetical protein
VGRLAELDGLLAEAERCVQEARGELAVLDLGVVDPAELRRALHEFEPGWEQLVPKERGRVLALLLERVVYDAESGEVEITFRRGARASDEHLHESGRGARRTAGEPVPVEK